MKKKRLLYLVALLLMVALGAKADALAVTSDDIGKVVCTDGSIYATRGDAGNANKTAVAMIAYIDEQNRTGLAIALNWTWQSYWSYAESTVEQWVTDGNYSVSFDNATWKVPTIQEWQQMLIGCGAEGTVSDNPTSLNCSGLNAKLIAAGASFLFGTEKWTYNEQDYENTVENYWTDSAIDENNVWKLSYNNNDDSDDTNDVAEFGSFNKDNDLYVRACLRFAIAEPPCLNVTTTDVGKLVCTDGKLYTKAEAEAASATPVAMIAHFDEQSKTGLAIALNDETNGIYVYEGNEYEDNWYSWERGKTKARAHTPTITGAVWRLPTIDEWKQMLLSCEGQIYYEDPDIITYDELNSKIYNVGGDVLKISDYWSSTGGVTDTDGNDAAMCPSFYDGKAHCNNPYRIDYSSHVRACFAFTVGGGDSGNVITSNTGSINMPAGGGEQRYVIAEGVQSFNVYDDGGANRNYSNTCEGTIILTAPEGCLLRLTGSVKTVYDSDCLDIWDGTSTNDYHIAGFSGESDEILPIISSGESLRLSFSSDQDDNAEGFALTVEVLTPTTIDNTTESINMPTNGLQKYVISQGVTSFNVYDNGGSDAPYSNNSDGTIILTAPEGCRLQLTGTVKTGYGNDGLRIYDGTSSYVEPLKDVSNYNYQSATTDIGIVSSTGRSLRLDFSSDDSQFSDGINLTVKVIDPNAKYDIAVYSATDGNVYISGRDEYKAKTGETVQLHISPSPGYMINNLIVVDEDGNTVSVSGGKWYNDPQFAYFTMPSSSVTITPSFTNAKTVAEGLYMNMPAQSSSRLSVNIPEGVQSFKLYDDGGANGNYNSGTSSIHLTVPEGYKIQLTGNVTTFYYEYLTVYNSNAYGQQVDQLIRIASSVNGESTNIGTIVSNGRYMNISFTAYNTDVYAGLDLTVTLVSEATEYDITISNPVSGGNIVAKVNNTQVTKAKVNDVVTLTATPAAGYVLSGISVVDGNSNAVSVTGGTWYNNTATFAMPSSAATVTPIFTNTLTGLSINMPTEGTVTATIPEGVSSFKVYDDGGENGAYSSNCNGNLVLTAPEGNMLQLTGTIASNSEGTMSVWDGTDTSDDEAKLLSGKYSSKAGVATTIGTPTSTDRYMTLNFTSSYNLNSYAGLDLTVTQINVCLADAAANSTVISTNNNRTGRNVLLAGRTLYKDGEWNTICLPFNVSLSDSPLAGATAKTLTSATMTGTTVSLTFGDAVTTLQAGVPYIIKWAKAEGYDQADPATRDIVNPLFTGVTVVSSTEAQRTIEKADGHVKFIGYYDPMTIDTPDNDDIYYMTTGNTLKHTGKQRTLKACRAYFQFSEAAQQARSFMLNFGDETTGIAEIRKVSDNSWYTLDGVKLDKQPTKKGLYISNGRKIVIK